MVPAVEQTQDVLWVGYVRIILISYLAFSISIFIQWMQCAVLLICEVSSSWENSVYSIIPRK